MFKKDLLCKFILNNEITIDNLAQFEQRHAIGLRFKCVGSGKHSQVLINLDSKMGWVRPDEWAVNHRSQLVGSAADYLRRAKLCGFTDSYLGRQVVSAVPLTHWQLAVAYKQLEDTPCQEGDVQFAYYLLRDVFGDSAVSWDEVAKLAHDIHTEQITRSET